MPFESFSADRVRETATTTGAVGRLSKTNDDGTEEPTTALAGLVEAINQNMTKMVEGQQMIVEHLSRPKQIVRDANGRAAGVV